MPSRAAPAGGQQPRCGAFAAGEPMARSLRLRNLTSGALVIEAQIRAVGGHARRLEGTS